MNSPYIYCNGNPVKYVDPDGREQRSWEDKIGDWMRDTFNSHSEIKEAQNVKSIAEGVALTNPVVGVTNAVLKISTGDDIYGNKVRTTDNGTKAVTNVRAVADFCEDISDVCDATAVGLAVTGVNMPVAVGMAKVGTIAGTISDGVNVGVDLYEGKTVKAGICIIGNLVGYSMSRITKTNNQRFEIVKNIIFDQIFNYMMDKFAENFNGQ